MLSRQAIGGLKPAGAKCMCLHRPNTTRRPVASVKAAAAAFPLGSSPQAIAATLQQNPALQLVASVFSTIQKLATSARDALHRAFPKIDEKQAAEINQQIRDTAGHLRVMAAFVLPLAKAMTNESLSAVYARTFEKAAFGFAKMYLFCLFMRVLLSWFPSIDWNAQPWTFLRLITEPYLQIYRGILPPLFGQLDFTPLIGFLILQDVVEVMAPTYTMGLHDRDTSTHWTTSEALCYFDGF